jgi:hypothetical protein
MQSGYIIVEQFFEAAGELRAAFEADFRDPDAHVGGH